MVLVSDDCVTRGDGPSPLKDRTPIERERIERHFNFSASPNFIPTDTHEQDRARRETLCETLWLSSNVFSTLLPRGIGSPLSIMSSQVHRISYDLLPPSMILNPPSSQRLPVNVLPDDISDYPRLALYSTPDILPSTSDSVLAGDPWIQTVPAAWAPRVRSKL